MRLGVVEGNLGVERFWKRLGCIETRKRVGLEAGDRVNTIRAMHKLLAGGSLRDYLALVPRDISDSA